MAIRLAPLPLRHAKEWVALYHSHHKPPVGHLWSVGAYSGEELIGCVIVSRPVAPALQAAGCMEVTRLCTNGHKNAASKLLGAAWGAAKAMGCRRMVSYTRVDEDGTPYRAAGWVATHRTEGRSWTSGNKRDRWLPGLYIPTTEIVDRIRWEIGPDAAATRADR